MTDMEGRNYQIISTLATGGTAVLYKAIQRSLDREVVIKRLHSHLTSDANFTKRFEVEAKAAASLDHENIVRIIDSGTSQGNYFIVMEYIDGFSLSEILERHGPLDDEIAMLIAREICIGLDHAHQHGIIHRDVKPANIMITATGQVKITDFGLAKLIGSQLQHTVADTLLGTPLYMSPEQAIGEGIDGRSDIFSLGTICYEMVTGRQPFIGNTYAAVIQKIIEGHIPHPNRINEKVSPEADRIIMKALSREPSKRFGTALEMARTIEACVGQEKVWSIRNRLRRLAGGSDPAVTVAGSAPAPLRRRGSARRWAAGIAAAAVIASMGYTALERPDIISGLKERAERAVEGFRSETPAGLLEASDTPGGPIESLLTAAADSVTAVEDSLAVETLPAEPLLAAGPPEGIAPEPDTIASEPEPVHAADPPAAREEEPATPEETAPAVGLIDIYVEPEAEIQIDGRWRAATGRFGPVELPEGPHDVVLRQQGYRDYMERIVIRRGELSRRRIELQRVTGGLDFSTVAGASVFVNGKFHGTTPLRTALQLPAGKYLVELKKHGYLTWTGEVDIPSNETLSLKINMIQRQ
jgi:tRNA A-37 threonylcarbamoyl transferase component Bud32